MEGLEILVSVMLVFLSVIAAGVYQTFRRSEHGKRVEIAFDLISERVMEIYANVDRLRDTINEQYEFVDGNYVEDELDRIAYFIEDQVEEWIKRDFGVSVDIRRIRDLIYELMDEDDDLV